MNFRERILLAGALALLATAVWIEPAGSWLGEPDEARYAEIPREMLATGDFVTPRLNGVPYFEKPPLLYWCNAASFAVFGETPWAARLTTRLAGAGTIAVLIAGLIPVWGVEAGLAAGVLYLVSPLGFVLSRLNLTDGLLTFFFAGTLLAARETLQRRQERKSWAACSALAGLAAGGALLTKGLVGVALPAAIVLFWCLATGRGRLLRALLLAPAPVVFVAVAAPWFLLVERRNPGFAQFFFIHEHFQRFATTQAHRPGPFYYFAGIFLGGFLPGLSFFLVALRGKPLSRWAREKSDFLFFLIWFAVGFLFFSVSSSKLPPYLLPAFPAAAALAARAVCEPVAGLGRWRVTALLATLLVAGIALHPATRQAISDYGLRPLLLPWLALFLAGVWTASALARRSIGAALLALAVGWFGFYAAAALAWPRVPAARDLHLLSTTARDFAQRTGADVVGFQAYVQSLPWELKHPIPVADYVGELEPWFERRPGVRDALFWSRERFWREWRSGRKILAVVRARDLGEFQANRVVLRGRKYDLVANFD